jgi:hypothetical protein
MNVRPNPVLGILVASVMLVPLLMTQSGDIGKSPRQVLDPKLVKQITGEPTETVPSSELAKLRGEVQAIHEQLQEMLSVSRIVATNTPRIADLEHRMDAMEARATAAENQQRSDPTNIAVLQAKMDSVIAEQAAGRTLAWGIASGIGALIVIALGVLVKRVVSKFKPPEWTRKETDRQEAFRVETSAKIDEAKDKIAEAAASAKAAYEKANGAFEAANNINAKLAGEGIKIVDERIE